MPEDEGQLTGLSDDAASACIDLLKALCEINNKPGNGWIGLQALLILVDDPGITYTSLRARMARRWGDVLIPSQPVLVKYIRQIGEDYPAVAPVLGMLRPAVMAKRGGDGA